MTQNLQAALPSPLELRAELEAMVRRDLLGPAGGPQEEVDEFAVSGRYVLSLLVVRVWEHGFHQTAQAVHFTPSETAPREVRGRLLDLHHQDHAEEKVAGLHKKKGKGDRSQEAKGRSQGAIGKAKREKRQAPLYPFIRLTRHDR